IVFAVFYILFFAQNCSSFECSPWDRSCSLQAYFSQQVNPSDNTLSNSNDVPGSPATVPPNLLYSTNENSNTVTYFNATNGNYLNGTLAASSFVTGANPWGAAVNPSANILYVTNNTSNTVTYFNATNGSYINGTLAASSFVTGNNVLSVAVNPSSNILYVINRNSDTVTYFNATNGNYINGTLVASSFATQVGGMSWGLEVNPSSNILYVTNFNSNNVTYFDATNGNYMNGTLPASILLREQTRLALYTILPPTSYT
ncbi:lactonase, 7-bladed beta-propeller domain protein, partial [Leptospira weilii serovar Ranarum str. ICFT]